MNETAPRKNEPKRRSAAKKSTSLIEFPGVSRNALPEWRRELGLRVREVQDKRAREAMTERAEAGPALSDSENRPAPALELLPQAEVTPMNPLVVAALRRIERAHSQPGGKGAATAVAYEEQPTLELNTVNANREFTEAAAKPERTHNLAVVQTPEVTESKSLPQTRRPRRIIGDHNDPALNYLDSVPTSAKIERRELVYAPIFRRMFSGLADLLLIGLLPVLALSAVTRVDWQNLQVIAIGAGAFLVVGFLYLTVSLALTGRTLGMKVFALRVVDARTGLIPTGSQSAGRSIIYLLSLAAAGIALLYPFIDADGKGLHDRLAGTAVIQA